MSQKWKLVTIIILSVLIMHVCCEPSGIDKDCSSDDDCNPPYDTCDMDN
jgi:hypothetical protein